MTVAEMFRPKDIRAARDIILTPEQGMTTDERWIRETPWIVEQVEHLTQPGDAVIDFGCGVGRIAREIGRKYLSIAVDASPEMRAMCVEYCAKDAPGVTVTDPWGLGWMAKKGLQADGAVAIWSLQHIPDLDNHVRWLASAIKPGGWLFVLNSHARWLPIENGWRADAVNVPTTLIQHGFWRQIDITLPPDLFGPDKWCSIFRKAA
jgi:SAM-dependent methyltransferase